MADGSAPARVAIPILRSAIEPDLSQPRRENAAEVFDVSDLTPSIRAHGILQALLVRRVGNCPDCDGEGVYQTEPGDTCRTCGGAGDRHGIISGERRWIAAGLVGLGTVPCVVRDDLSPAEVLEIQIIENAARADLSPLREAAAFERLRTEHALAVEDIAARVGKSARLVRQRLALLGLVPTFREELAAGRLTLAAALAFATLPTEAQEDAAVKALQLAEHSDGGALDLRTVRHLIRERQLRLDGAGFPLADASLPGGACSACPKRTSAQALLWADALSDDDRCTDRPCFDGKRKAWATLLVESARSKGLRVLDEKAARKVLPGGYLAPLSGLIDLDAPCPVRDDDAADHDGASPRKPLTWRMVLPALAASTVAVGDDGKAHELVEEATVKVALQKAKPEAAKQWGHLFTAPEVRPAAPPKAPEPPKAAPPGKASDRDRAALQANKAARDKALLAIGAKSAPKGTLVLWRLLACLIARTVGEGAREDVCSLLSLDGDSLQALLDVLVAAPEDAARATSLQLLAAHSDETFALACTWAGVDTKAAPEKAKASKKKSAAASDEPAKPEAPAEPTALDRQILKLCAKGRTLRQIEAGCRDHDPVLVELRVDAIQAAGRLVLDGRKLRTVEVP